MADEEGLILIDDLSYADPTRYHPHDALMYKYFSAGQIASSRCPSALYDLALEQEEEGLPPPRTPWPLPPPRPREELELGVEEWRASTLRTIDERIARYDVTRRNFLPRNPSVASDARYDRQHRALGVNELLEVMLRNATPSAQYAAWNVSRGWRDMVRYILETQFRDPYPCAPVERGDAVQPTLGWEQPPDSEIVEFQETVDTLSRTQAFVFKAPSDSFLTARLSHAENLPPSTFDTFRSLCELKFTPASVQGLLSRSDGPCWMDLSQFQINPYFLEHFDDSLQLWQGSCAITVKPSLQTRLQDRVLSKGLKELVETMFITSPPCKVLGIYALSPSSRELQLVKRLRRPNGIRIGDLLLQVRQYIPTAIEYWRARSHSMRERIAKAEWSRLSSREQKLSMWFESGFPKLLVFLESGEQSDPTFAQFMYSMSTVRGLSDECEEEWKQLV